METLREIGRLLSLYLTVAEYLAARRDSSPYPKAIEASMLAACLHGYADFEAVEHKLRQALNALKAFMRTNPFDGVNSPMKEAAKYDLLIRSGVELIEEVFVGIGFPPIERVRYAHIYLQMAGAVLLERFPTRPQIRFDELTYMEVEFVDPMLRAALALMQSVVEPSPLQLRTDLETFDLEMIQRMENKDQLEPGLYGMNVIIMHQTRARFQTHATAD